MADTFASYEEFIERFVEPLHAGDPGRKRLNGNLAGDRTVAAWIIYEGDRYMVHADSIIASLLAPYRASKRGEVRHPIIGGVTRNGKAKLIPAPGAGESRGFYIYLGREK